MSEAAEGPGQERMWEVPALPGTPIGRWLSVVESGGLRAVLLGPTPIQVFDATDAAATAAAMAMLSRAGVASDAAIAAAFGCHRNTVGRLARRLAAEGLAAVVPARRGPKGPSKVTPEVAAVIAAEARQLSGPRLVEAVAERTGVRLSRSYVAALAAGARARQLELPGGDPAVAGASWASPMPSAGASDAGAAGDDDRQRAAAGAGVEPGAAAGVEPPAILPGQVRGRYMGLALYYPALAALGLVEVARSVYALPRSARFGVRAVTLCLCFLTLLRKPTLEAAKHLRRAEFGAVVGAGRAPAVKTLRRKLAELVGQAAAAELGTRLARRWVEGGLVATAYLYVDGHMKAYTGKRRLQEVWSSQRRMPLPGVHTYHVADGDGRPLLFLTEALSTNLARAMPRIVEAIRDAVGDRAFSVVFDRGGYDGGLFAWLTAQGIGFITYQRGSPDLPLGRFRRREARFEGRRVRFQLAEDEVSVGRNGPWRRVVVRTRDGHQTPILTNLAAERVGPARLACLMFARWRQENVFKYMGEHHGLDQLISYAAEAADPATLVPNPQRRLLDRRIAERRRESAALRAALGGALLDEPTVDGRSAHDLRIAQGDAVRRLRTLEREIDALVAERRPLPRTVPVADTGASREVMRLEHKAIVDRIKISAYNAEEWLLDRLVGHYPNPHDARDLLRSFAELSGEIRTTDGAVHVTLDPPDTPIHRRALRGLVDDLNTIGATYPGTDIPVTYRVAVHQSEAAA